MKQPSAGAIIDAVAAWARKRDDVRALALVGSWARGNPHPASDIDLLLLSECAQAYRRRRKWLAEINFSTAGYSIKSTKSVAYGAAWSRHIHLFPAAEVELTFADCSWARRIPIEAGTRAIVKDAFRIIVDKDGILAKLFHAVMNCRAQ